jgi:hypothetical protein
VIAKVCETWWIDERPGAELLVAQLLPYLLVHALSDEGKAIDAKRLYKVRGALLLFDFEDESIESLKVKGCKQTNIFSLALQMFSLCALLCFVFLKCVYC